MLSHVTVGITDFDRAFTFYSAVMEALGYPLRFREDHRHWAGWEPRDAARPLFIITKPQNGEAQSSGNGQMTVLLASSREAVELSYEVALTHGGTDEGEPGLRQHYHPHYYGAYFRDPEGNKMGVACHQPVD